MSTPNANLWRLAQIIEQDIRQRGLQPGAPYLTAQEAAAMLGVSTMTANRAMQLLAERGVLERKKKRGTIIGMLMDEDARQLRCIHCLVKQDYFRTEGVLTDGLIAGIQSVVGPVDVQFNCLPATEPLLYVQHLVQQAMGSAYAMVLVSVPISVKRFVAERRIPAVIFGTPEPGFAGIPWIDRQQRVIGRILMRHLLDLGHREVAVVFRDWWGPGETLTLAGIHEVADEAGLRAGAVRTVGVPADEAVIAATARELLEAPTPPTGIICRSAFQAEAMREVVDAAQARLGRLVDVAVCDHYRIGPAPWYAYARPQLDAEARGQQVGRLLLQQVQGLTPDPDHISIPVTLETGHAAPSRGR